MIGIIIGLLAELGIAATVAVAPVWSYSHHWGIAPLLAVIAAEVFGARLLFAHLNTVRRELGISRSVN